MKSPEQPRFPISTDGKEVPLRQVVDSAYSILSAEKATTEGSTEAFRKRVESLIPFEDDDEQGDARILTKLESGPVEGSPFSDGEYASMYAEAVKVLLDREWKPVDEDGQINPDAEVNDVLRPIVLKYWNIREYEFEGDHYVRKLIAESIGEEDSTRVSANDVYEVQQHVAAEYHKDPSESLEELTATSARQYFKEKTIARFNAMPAEDFRREVAQVVPLGSRSLSEADLDIIRNVTAKKLRESDFSNMPAAIRDIISNAYLFRMEARTLVYGKSTEEQQ